MPENPPKKISELISDLKPKLAKIFLNPVLTSNSSNRIIQGPVWGHDPVSESVVQMPKKIGPVGC